MVALLFQSDEIDKGFKVMLADGSIVHHGSPDDQNFTMQKDDNRNRPHIIRHNKKNENWNRIRTTGIWSRWSLWNSASLSASIRNKTKSQE